MWGEPVITKKKAFMDYINNHLNPNRPNLMVIHVATAGAEIDALKDANSKLMSDKNGKSIVGLHRETELNMILSPDFRNLNGKKFRMINYAQLLKGKDISELKATKVVWPVGSTE
jgi:hypothetical protein